jgi:hypothetical protein
VIILGFKSEVDFGVDSFKKPKILNPKESVAQIILNLFMMRPGSMPSMPHIGINIQSYLYKMEEDLNVEGLKQQIFSQCTELLSFISIGDIQVSVVPYEGQYIMLVILPIIGLDDTDSALLLGFKQDQNNNLLFNYKFENGTVIN